MLHARLAAILAVGVQDFNAKVRAFVRGSLLPSKPLLVSSCIFVVPHLPMIWWAKQAYAPMIFAEFCRIAPTPHSPVFLGPTLPARRVFYTSSAVP